MNVEGYPPIFLITTVAVGIPITVLRPYTGFLLAVLFLTAGNAAAFNQTRTELFGPYINLGDAFLLISLAALLFDSLRGRKPLRIPRVVTLLLFVLIVAACQSFWKLGWTHETARACRWALEVPTAFLLGANLVTSASRAKKLLGALMCGVILAVSQHLFFVSMMWISNSSNVKIYHLIRTISYSGGGISAAFLLTGLIWKMPKNIGKRILCLIVGVLLLMTLLMSQTRSVWIAAAGTVPCLLLLFKRRNRIIMITRFVAVVFFMVLAVGWICQRALPGFDILKTAADRIQLLTEEDEREAQIGTRERALKIEMGSWLDGTLVLGRGLYFFQTMPNPDDMTKRVAFGHLGYVSYLSQMGLIGLCVYGFYFPLMVIRDGRRLWWHSDLPVLRYTGLLGTASIICLSIMFSMSSSFLSLGYFAPSVLYGSMWSLVRSEPTRLAETCAVEGPESC